ncbi:MAG: OmpW family outer membrane protein [Aquabacterium sp.]|nr:OmpW family outer membrane protein [Aquabacterium sp.]
MTFSALSRTGFAVALAAALGSVAAPAAAQIQSNSIFSQVAPAARDRMFFRINYVHANVKTTSGDVRDVSGNLYDAGDIEKYLGVNNTSGPGGTLYVSPHYPQCGTDSASASACRLAGSSGNLNSSGFKAYLGRTNGSISFNKFLEDALVADGLTGLGTPKGVKAVSDDSVGTPAISVGYFLTDDYSWFVEALVLAAPITAAIRGDGVNANGRPVGISGVNVIKAKLLPPTAIFGRYFGRAGDRIRPFLGLGASYAMFFDVKATDALNQYVGGQTNISVKNAMGFGAFLGARGELNDDWHVNFSVGKLKYKTEATLLTSQNITSSTGVLKDLSLNVANTVGVADDNFTPTTPGLTATDAFMCDLAAAKYKSANCNLGTFVRKQSTVLDNTMFMFSVGRKF